MSKLILKGFDKSISFSFFEKLMKELLIEYNSSMNFSLSIPVVGDEFKESILDYIRGFKTYFIRRVKIDKSQSLIRFKTRIRGGKDVLQSVSQALDEISASQSQILIWKDKVNDGRYGESSLKDKDKRLYYLFKYELFFNYLKINKLLLIDLLDFLSENYRDELIQVKNSENKTSLNLKGAEKGDEIVGEELLTIDEVCNLLQKSRSTIYRWCKTGYINKRNIGGSIFFFKNEILKKIKDN